jgi:isopenicillin N synthase-like dioxygenase
MNKKYPFTPEGVKRQQDELFKLPDADLQKVTLTMAQDLRSYIYTNFEVTAEQKDYYDKIPQGYNLWTGWQSASAILIRTYVDFGDVPASYDAAQKKARTTTTEVSANVTYSESAGWGGSGGVKFTFK